MSDLLRDAVYVMPGLSMACLEELGESVLQMFQPSALEAPEPVDVLGWIDRILPRFGVHVAPAGREELGDCAAITYPTGNFECEILVQEWMWHDLAHDAHPYFVRATLIHELAHAILHVPVIRGSEFDNSRAALPRAARGSMPAFNDPEWQAWALPGSILLPRRTIAMLAEPHVSAVMNAYEVSGQFAAAHLRRLKIEAGGTT